MQWFDHLPVEEENLSADLVVDFLFNNDPARIAWLQQPCFACVMVNWQGETLQAGFVKFNGWPGFTGQGLLEVSSADESIKAIADSLAAQVGKRLEWSGPGQPFIGASIVSAIINEAFITLEEGAGTQEGIDIAMKLGTNYPYGPFEWAGQIGYITLLAILQGNDGVNPGNCISMLLKEKALAQ